MSQFAYSGPSGDQYEKFKKKYYEDIEAEKAKTIEAETVEETSKEVAAPKKATATKK